MPCCQPSILRVQGDAKKPVRYRAQWVTGTRDFILSRKARAKPRDSL